MQKIQIKKWEGDKLVVKDFYRTFNYQYEPKPDDEILLAFSGNEMVGVVRLSTENGILVLRGMNVKEDLRKQGIGKAMLEKLSVLIGDRECYCIPYAHLKDFYGRIGFEIINENDAPVFIQERILSYNEKNIDKKYIIMKKRGKRDLL